MKMASPAFGHSIGPKSKCHILVRDLSLCCAAHHPAQLGEVSKEDRKKCLAGGTLQLSISRNVLSFLFARTFSCSVLSNASKYCKYPIQDPNPKHFHQHNVAAQLFLREIQIAKW